MSATGLKYSIPPQGGHVDIKSQPLASKVQLSAGVQHPLLRHTLEKARIGESKCVVPERKEEL